MKENNGKEPTAEQLEACRRRADEAMEQMEDAGMAQIADTVIYVDEMETPIETTIDERAKACQAALDALDKALKEEKLSDAEAVAAAGELVRYYVIDWLSAHPEEADKAQRLLQRIHDDAMEETRRDYTKTKKA